MRPLLHRVVVQLCILCSISLAACTGRNEGSDAAVPQSQPAKEIVKIGAILPMTGSAAELSVQHRRGLEFGVEHLNQLGGINGKRVELVLEDDQNDPKMTIAAFKKLVHSDRVQALVTVMSGPSMAIAPFADQEGVPLFANCGHPDVTRLHKNVFRNFPSSNLEVRRMAAFSSETLKIKTLWLLYIDDAYGQGARDLAVKEFPAQGIQVLGNDGYGKAGTDIRPALVRVAEAKPDAVYAYGYGKATADAVNQLREVGYKGTLLGSYNFSQPPLTTVSKASIQGSYYTVPNINYETTEEARTFFKAYRGKFSADPIWNGVVEYDAIMTLAKGSEIASQQKIALREGLQRVGRFAGVAGTYNYDSETKDWLTPMSIAHISPTGIEYLK